MSQLTAARTLPRRLPVSVPLRAPLRVIPARITRTGNGAFAATCVVLLTLGLIALLVLNTALAQGSLALATLEREAGVLGDSASNLREEIDIASSSASLAVAAGELGMVRAEEHAYVDLAAGTVTGEAQPANRGGAFPVVRTGTPMRTAPKELIEAARRVSVVANGVAAEAATPTTADVPAAGATAGTLGTATALAPDPTVAPTATATGTGTAAGTATATGTQAAPTPAPNTAVPTASQAQAGAQPTATAGSTAAPNTQQPTSTQQASQQPSQQPSQTAPSQQASQTAPSQTPR